MKLTRSGILQTLAALWALWVLSGYVRGIPSWSDTAVFFRGLSCEGARPARALSLAAGVWLPALALLLVQWGWGRLVRNWLRLRTGSPFSDTALEWGAGFMCLTAAVMALGLCGLYRTAAMVTVAVLLGCVAVWRVYFRRGIVASGRRDQGRAGLSGMLLAATGGLAAVLALLHTLVPETFYDTLSYVLGTPQGWLADGGLVDRPDNFIAMLHQGAGLYFLPGLAMGGTSCAKTLGLFALPACALLLGGWAHGRSGGRGLWAAVGLALGFPLLSLNTWAARADGWMAFFILLAWFSYDRWMEEGKGAWGAFAGLAAGCAFSIKYVALLAFLPLPLAYLGRREWGVLKTGWSLFLAGALLSDGAWIVFDLVHTGDPVFPYLSGLLGSGRMDPGTLSLLLSKNRLYDVAGWAGWLRLPWELTMPGGRRAQMIGPLALMGAPWVLLRWKDLGAMRRPLAAALAFAALCLASSRNLRFEMASFLLLGAAVSALASSGARGVGRAAAHLVLLGAVLAPIPFLLQISVMKMDAAGVWTGRETPEQYVERKIPHSYLPLARLANAEKEGFGRVLVLGDARGTYFQTHTLVQWVDERPLLARALEGSPSPEGIFRFLKRRGVTRLAVNGDEAAEANDNNGPSYRLTREGWRCLHEFMGRCSTLRWSSGRLAYYDIHPPRDRADGPGEPDGLSYLTPAAARYAAALGSGDLENAEKCAAWLSETFPRDAAWEKALHPLETRKKPRPSL